MKKSIALLTSCLLIAAGDSFAGTAAKAPVMAPPPSDAGWYFGLNGGFLWIDDATFGNAHLDFDTGWGAHAAVGYRFDNGISLGLSSGYLNGEFDSISGPRGNRVGVSADLRIVPITFNAAYSLKLTEKLSFYLGAGLGTAWSELDLDSIQGVGVDATSDDGWNLAWQARGGFSYDVSEELSLTLGYRFVDITDALGRFGDAEGHMAEAGFKIRF